MKIKEALNVKFVVSGNTFNLKVILKRHMATHGEKKPFQSYSCSLSFFYKSEYENHIIVHTGKMPFNCEKCGKGYTNKYNCKKHVLKCEVNKF